MKSLSKYPIIILASISMLTFGCGAFFRLPQLLPGADDANPEQRGERIYFTATNTGGERIRYRGGPSFGGMMMGSYLTCSACHGPEARGGTHFMHMQVMDAPDIRYEALQGEADEHGSDDHEADGHAHEGGEYTLEDFRLAVVEGLHPDGGALSGDMPRWEMEDQDLADLFAFLKFLP